MEKKLQKIYLTYYILLIAQDLGQAHYQFLAIVFMKKLIELNLSLDTIIKNVKLVELNTGIATVFSNSKTLKMI